MVNNIFKGGIIMRVKIMKSITDSNGNQTSIDMLGKEYEVIKVEELGVWVKEGKLDTFLYFEEVKILELDSKLSTVFFHYLRDTTKEKFNEELVNSDCTHLM
jgi:hypothetical protein